MLTQDASTMDWRFTMKKLLKGIVTLASLAAMVAGAYYLIKKYVLDDDLSDFDLYDDLDNLNEFDDDFDEELNSSFMNEENNKNGKEYVKLDLSSAEGAATPDAEAGASEDGADTDSDNAASDADAVVTD